MWYGGPKQPGSSGWSADRSPRAASAPKPAASGPSSPGGIRQRCGTSYATAPAVWMLIPLSILGGIRNGYTATSLSTLLQTRTPDRRPTPRIRRRQRLVRRRLRSGPPHPRRPRGGTPRSGPSTPQLDGGGQAEWPDKPDRRTPTRPPRGERTPSSGRPRTGKSLAPTCVGLSLGRRAESDSSGRSSARRWSRTRKTPAKTTPRNSTVGVPSLWLPATARPSWGSWCGTHRAIRLLTPLVARGLGITER